MESSASGPREVRRVEKEKESGSGGGEVRSFACCFLLISSEARGGEGAGLTRTGPDGLLLLLLLLLLLCLLLACLREERSDGR